MAPLCRSGTALLVAGLSLSLIKPLACVNRASVWPEGQFGLPKPVDGCPKSTAFTWETGTLFQDCEDTNPKTSKSPSYHLAGYVKNDVLQEFCVKTNTINDNNNPPWPIGQYCIYQKGDTCPSGLESGWVVWDDESEVIGKNKNARNGTLPKGTYDRDTKMYFCCSTKGNKITEIDLPLSSPFFLIAYKDSSCQRVRGATATREFIYYETEYYTKVTKNDFGGAYPYRATRTRYGHTIYYCYYRPNYCPPLSNFINGHVYPPRCAHANSNAFNDTCTAHCNPGFIPRDSYVHTSTCGDDGRWNATPTTTCLSKPTARAPTTFQNTPATIQHIYTSNNSILTTPYRSINTPRESSIPKPGERKTPRTRGKITQGNYLTSKFSVANTNNEEQEFGTQALSEEEAGLSSVGRIIAGSISGAVVLLGVLFIVCFSHCRRGNSKKKEKDRLRALDKSKSLEELVTGRIIHRSVSEENLIYADPISCQVEYTVKTDENPLYVSFDSSTLTTPDRTTDNVLYESVSPLLPSFATIDLNEQLSHNYQPSTL